MVLNEIDIKKIKTYLDNLDKRNGADIISMSSDEREGFQKLLSDLTGKSNEITKRLINQALSITAVDIGDNDSTSKRQIINSIVERIINLLKDL